MTWSRPARGPRALLWAPGLPWGVVPGTRAARGGPLLQALGCVAPWPRPVGTHSPATHGGHEPPQHAGRTQHGVGEAPSKSRNSVPATVTRALTSSTWPPRFLTQPHPRGDPMPTGSVLQGKPGCRRGDTSPVTRTCRFCRTGPPAPSNTPTATEPAWPVSQGWCVSQQSDHPASLTAGHVTHTSPPLALLAREGPASRRTRARRLLSHSGVTCHATRGSLGQRLEADTIETGAVLGDRAARASELVSAREGSQALGVGWGCASPSPFCPTTLVPACAGQGRPGHSGQPWGALGRPGC